MNTISWCSIQKTKSTSVSLRKSDINGEIQPFSSCCQILAEKSFQLLNIPHCSGFNSPWFEASTKIYVHLLLKLLNLLQWHTALSTSQLPSWIKYFKQKVNFRDQYRLCLSFIQSSVFIAMHCDNLDKIICVFWSNICRECIYQWFSW